MKIQAIDNSGIMKFMSASSLWVGGALLVLAFLMYGWSDKLLVSALVVGSLVFMFFLGSWLQRSVLTGYGQGLSAQDAYFTPKLVHADQALQALSARVRGTYRRGAADWSSFADPSALQSTPDNPPDPVWGRGSVVRSAVQELQVEVTYGVQPMSTGERGLLAVWQWFVLAPGVTISTTNPVPRLNRFDASWSSDEDTASGPEKLRHYLVHGAASAAGRQPMPPAVMSARQRLSEKASKITLGSDHVFVIGRPLPRAPQDPRDYGQGDFDVESLVDLVERTLAFTRALQSG